MKKKKWRDTRLFYKEPTLPRDLYPAILTVNFFNRCASFDMIYKNVKKSGIHFVILYLKTLGFANFL